MACSFHVLFELVHIFHLGRLECAHALEHLVKVNLVTVKLRTVHADKLCLSADSDAACATHTRSVDHDSVERNVSRNIIFLSKEAAELHHDSRTNGKALVHLLALDDLLYTYCHYALLTIRTVVGHDDDLVRMLAHLVLEDDEFLCAASQDRDDLVASSLKSLDDREHWSYSHTASGAHDSAELLNVSGLTQRTHDVSNVVALVELAKFG